ncbi:MAG TPA: FlgD immunoglobulin-like domain containing protein [Candidatus Eisenbacteria bacterium]|nr:FlgD immunoglobulin-like domain containing protein [Candidatus Eisenbacteria bacterium]
MMRRTLALALALIAYALPAQADTTFEYLFSGGYGLSVSQDGTVIAGNTKPGYFPFRWTRSGGFQSLGLPATPSNGQAWVSYDGTRVAGCIESADTTHATCGLWSVTSGWKYLQMPPDAQVTDNDGGSPYGLSGDGNTVVGLYWSATTNKGHGFKWTEATGGVDLGSSGRSSRANGVNYDGSVIVGWDEDLQFGYRRPCVWLNGVLQVLATDGPGGEVVTSNSSGDVLGGFVSDSLGNYRWPTLWHRSGGSWTRQTLPLVPGTETGGINDIKSITADGKMAVGYCSFAGDPFFTTGFVWTDSTGCEDVVQFLGERGVLPDPSFQIQTLTSVTPDGTMLIGFGYDTVAPNQTRTFMIHLDRAAVGVPRNGSPTTRLLSAAPNPVRATTTLSFSLPQASAANRLTIHDSAGRLVRTLASGALAAGPHSLAWDARDESGARVPAGVYFTQLVAGSHREMSKLVVVK